jgi:hypothetical protein
VAQPTRAGRRRDAALGALGAILFVVAFALLSRPPSPSASAANVTDYLTTHRANVFAAALVLGAASTLFLWFSGTLRGYLADEEDDSRATSTIVMLLGGIVVVLSALAVLAALVLHVRQLRPTEAVLGFDVYNALITMAGFWFAGAVVAATRARSLPRRYRQAGVVVAVAQLATLPGLFVRSGIFAAGGTIAVLAFWLLSAWFIAVAVRIARRPVPGGPYSSSGERGPGPT